MFYWITLIILLFVTYSAFNLSIRDWKKKNVCPKIAGIPACYIVFTCFLIALISHILNTNLTNKIYCIGIGIPALIALIGSITEISGKTICPKTNSGIPMCYISLAFCVVLIVVKYLSL